MLIHFHHMWYTHLRTLLLILFPRYVINAKETLRQAKPHQRYYVYIIFSTSRRFA